MLLTILLAVAMLPGTVRADDAIPHIVAVAVARAEIVSGVRVGQVGQDAQGNNAQRQSRDVLLPKPRERPCPEREATPCRLIVVDMP